MISSREYHSGESAPALKGTYLAEKLLRSSPEAARWRRASSLIFSSAERRFLIVDNGGEPLVRGEEDESEVEDDALGILRMGLQNFGLGWSLGLREGKEMAGFNREEVAIFVSFGVKLFQQKW